MKTIHVKAHERRKPAKPLAYVWMTERLWNEVAGRECVSALEHALSEPLDGPQFGDTADGWKQERREIW